MDLSSFLSYSITCAADMIIKDAAVMPAVVGSDSAQFQHSHRVCNYCFPGVFHNEIMPLVGLD